MSRAFRFNGKPSACYRDFFLAAGYLGADSLVFFPAWPTKSSKSDFCRYEMGRKWCFWSAGYRQKCKKRNIVGMKWLGNGVCEAMDTDKNAKSAILSVWGAIPSWLLILPFRTVCNHRLWCTLYRPNWHFSRLGRYGEPYFSLLKA